MVAAFLLTDHLAQVAMLTLNVVHTQTPLGTVDLWKESLYCIRRRLAKTVCSRDWESTSGKSQAVHQRQDQAMLDNLAYYRL